MPKLMWSRYIVDEINTITLPNNEKINAVFTWFITSSLFDLYYNRFKNKGYLRNIWDQMSSHYPSHTNSEMDSFTESKYYNKIPHCAIDKDGNCISHIGRMLVICDKEFIDKSFNMPQPTFEKIICKAPVQLNIVKDFVNKNVSQLLNAGDVQGAIIELGGDISTTDNIVNVITENLRVKIFNKEKN